MELINVMLFQEIEKSKAFQVGYEVGYFVGSNSWEVVTAAVVILAVILYLAFFRKKKSIS